MAFVLLAPLIVAVSRAIGAMKRAAPTAHSQRELRLRVRMIGAACRAFQPVAGADG